MSYNKIANDIVKDIECDITMRRGIGDVWEKIDEDIKKDIKTKWTNIIVKELKFQLQSKNN